MRTSAHSTLAALVALTLLTACGGSDDGKADTTSGGDGTSVTDSTAGGDTTPTEESLPAPDPATFVGVNQVVNLAVLPDGSTPELDIWALRTFTNAPVLLVEGLQYGEVSEAFSSPPGAVVAAVMAGAGPDADQFSGMFSADDGQHYTTVIAYDRDSQAASGILLEDVDPNNPTMAFPDTRDGQALVMLWAYQLTLNPLAEEGDFETTIGGKDVSYQVGIEGTTGCAPQPRQTEQGYSPMVLGGTQRVPFDVAAGDTTFTFHGWGTYNEDCADASVIDPITVTLAAGDRVWVMLHSRDGQTVESLVVPMA